jgi:hypothetical protein
MAKQKIAPVTTLKGWTAISKFMGTTPASAQTWAKQGMPVKREGRFTTVDPAEVQAWLPARGITCLLQAEIRPRSFSTILST